MQDNVQNEIGQIIALACQMLKVAQQLSELDKTEAITLDSASKYMNIHEISSLISQSKRSRGTAIKSMRSILRETAEGVRAYEIKDVAPVPANYNRIVGMTAIDYLNAEVEKEREYNTYVEPINHAA